MEGSPLDNIITLLLIFPEMPVFHCVELSHDVLSLFRIHMPTGVNLVEFLFRQPCWCVFIGVAFLTFLGNMISNQNWRFLGSHNICTPSSASIPEPWMQELCCLCIAWDWVTWNVFFSTFWLIVLVCNDLLLGYFYMWI